MQHESSEHIRALTLDQAITRNVGADAEREREAALRDLLAANCFAPHCIEASGPYDVHLCIRDNRLYFTIESEKLPEHREVVLPVAPFRRTVKDYFLVFESYLEAIKTGESHRIEAIDMARRGIHNDGAEKLEELLKDRISLDFDTARRLFTLICVLHIT